MKRIPLVDELSVDERYNLFQNVVNSPDPEDNKRAVERFLKQKFYWVTRHYLYGVIIHALDPEQKEKAWKLLIEMKIGATDFCEFIKYKSRGEEVPDDFKERIAEELFKSIPSLDLAFQRIIVDSPNAEQKERAAEIILKQEEIRKDDLFLVIIHSPDSRQKEKAWELSTKEEIKKHWPGFKLLIEDAPVEYKERIAEIILEQEYDAYECCLVIIHSPNSQQKQKAWDYLIKENAEIKYFEILVREASGEFKERAIEHLSHQS